MRLNSQADPVFYCCAGNSDLLIRFFASMVLLRSTLNQSLLVLRNFQLIAPAYPQCGVWVRCAVVAPQHRTTCNLDFYIDLNVEYELNPLTIKGGGMPALA